MKNTLLLRTLAALLSVAGGLLLGCIEAEDPQNDDCPPGLCAPSGDDGDPEPGEPDALCEALCTVVIECGSTSEPVARCVEECRAELDAAADVSADCEHAIEALDSCLSRLACSEYEEYWDEPTGGYPCAHRDEDVGAACDVAGNTGGTENDGDACTADGGSCSVMGDCCGFDGGDALCVDDVCSPICLDDADCAAGQRCADLFDSDGNPFELDACVPDGDGSDDEDECDTDSDCPNHEICVAGRCEYADCTSDAHCSGCNRCVSNYCSYCGEGPYGCYC
jgi:hypothetical protein